MRFTEPDAYYVVIVIAAGDGSITVSGNEDGLPFATHAMAASAALGIEFQATASGESVGTKVVQINPFYGL